MAQRAFTLLLGLTVDKLNNFIIGCFKDFSRNNFGRVPVSVKRLIQSFNKKVPSYIGCKSYMGPNSFFFFEKFLMDELTKLNIYSNNSFTSWKTPYPSDSSKTMFSHRSSKRPIKKSFLPKINTGVNSMSMSDREYLEVRIKVKSTGIYSAYFLIYS